MRSILQEKTLFSEGIFLEVFWMILTKDLFKRLDRLGEDSFVEWNLKSNLFDKLPESVFATELAEFDVFLPSVLMRTSILIEELERTHLRKRVVNVVERKLEDVNLGEPAMTGI